MDISLKPEHGIDWTSRLRAGGIHFGLSLLVAALAAALVFGVWYPTPFREISGGRELFSMLVAVDVVLGPLLTFAVFDRRKPAAELRRDLAVIVLLQLGALGYGMHTVWIARPVYLAFEVDRFRVVRAIDVDARELATAAPEFRELPSFGPRLIAAEPPTDPDEKFRSIQLALQGVDIFMRPATWRPYASAKAQVLAHAKPLADLGRRGASATASIARIAARAGVPVASLGYLPVVARELGWVAVVALPGAEVVGYLPFGGF